MNLQPKYLYAAGVIYLTTAFFSLGHLHPDEYYQILEFAAYKLNLNSAHGLTWEFYEQIRPTSQAWLVVYLYKLIALVTQPNPFMVAFLTRAGSGILSLVATYLFIQTFKSELKSRQLQRWLMLLSIFSWLALFNSIRYSSENISAKLFLIGLCLLLRCSNQSQRAAYLSIGVILGLSFITRFQSAFMLLGLGAWLLLIRRLSWLNCLYLILGIAVAIAFGTWLDYEFYGNWVATPWRYFAANILQGKAASFSVDPWYMYLAIAGLVPYGPLYIVATLYFIFYRPKHVVTWIMLPFILAHLMVAHKELRFLTPLLSFMPLVILDSLQILREKYNFQLGPKLLKLNRYAWRLNCVGIMVVMFFPSAMQIRINQLLYHNYPQATAFNYITEGGNILDFYKHLNLRPVAINNPAQLECKPNESCLLALTCQETVNYGVPAGKLIFSDCPSWIFKLDFNGWLERTALYNIYQLPPQNGH